MLSGDCHYVHFTSGEPDGTLRAQSRAWIWGRAGTLGRAMAVRGTPLGHTQLSKGEHRLQDGKLLCPLEPAPRCLGLPGEPQTQEVAEWCGWTRLGSWLHHLQAGDLGQPPPSPEPPFSHPKMKDNPPPGAGGHKKTGKTHTALNTCQAQSKRSVNGVCPSHSQSPVLSMGSGGRRSRGVQPGWLRAETPGGQGSGPDA